MSVLSTTATLDRLVSSLFVATLATGGLILGVSFDAHLASSGHKEMALDVVLVQSAPVATEQPDTDYVSEQSHLGEGNTRERVPVASQISTGAQIDNPGEEQSVNPFEQKTTPIETQRQIIAAKHAFAELAWINPENTELPSPEMTAQLMRASLAELEPVSQRYHTTQAQADDPSDTLTTVATRASDIAPYLANWKRKVEFIGTEHFPEFSRYPDAKQNPTVQVVIDQNGRLTDILIQRSSGSLALDDKVLSILRLASPFDPFPADLRQTHDQVEFVYEWHFKR